MNNRAPYVRPSSAATWLRCAGYAALNSQLGAAFPEDEDNEVREDGTACHWLAEWFYATGEVVPVGTIAPNGRTITEEMHEALALYRNVHDRRFELSEPMIEWKLPVSQVFMGVQNGTADRLEYVPDDLYVDDLKFGFRPVEVWFNPQLFLYAVTYAVKWKLPAGTRIHLTIIQPRAQHRDGPVREWVFTLDDPEVQAFIAQLRAAALAQMAPNPICTPNPGCRNCGGRAACEALRVAGLDAVEQGYTSTPHLLNDVELAFELHLLRLARARIDARIDGLEVDAEYRARSGSTIPGFAMQPKPTRRRWRSDTEIEVLETLLGKSLHKQPALMSPRQAESVIGKELVDNYSIKPTGALSLTEVDPNEVRRKFSQHQLNWSNKK